ncbi:hypothetical protein ACFFX0_32100 [Citricoccus parietis]|uniref:Uncharacterized protein n=1 Tax=Citricoccus parietis TaxID=592307 RepID=A0ABV5G9F3_9MICC
MMNESWMCTSATCAANSTITPGAMSTRSAVLATGWQNSDRPATLPRPGGPVLPGPVAGGGGQHPGRGGGGLPGRPPAVPRAFGTGRGRA